MADIFISYARADRPRAERLAQALERTGWSVWWDREIPPGRSFDEVIEEALSQARCVIVLWSDASIRSEWVKTEASEAAQRRILVPILADGARIPLEFRRIQAAAISDWRDLEGNDGWAHLCDAVAALVDSPRRAPPARQPAVRVRRARSRWVLAAVLPLVLLAAAVSLAVRWHSSPAAAAPAVAAAPALAPAATKSTAAAPVVPAAPPAVSEPAPEPVAKARPPVRPPPVARVPETIAPPISPAAAPAAAAHVADVPLAPSISVADVARRLDREPRRDAAATFDVTLVYGVFRDQAGRLSVSPAGVRFNDTSGSGRTFELTCDSLRRVATATMIADREQRLLELASNEQAYRVRASDTGARDSIRDAIGRSCGR